MQTIVDHRFCGQDLSWFNTMRMAIKALSLADIVTADDKAITHQAYLLKHSNGLHDSFDWSRFPPVVWSPPFINLWVQALKSCFTEPFGIPNSRTLMQVSTLGK